MSKKVIIIGAGLGGMSAAVHLANKGFEVEVFESQSFAGGKVGYLEKAGYRFDTGPSLLTMPFVFENLFKESNEDIEEYLKIKPLEVLTKYFYADGTIINAYSDPEKFAEEIEAKTIDSKESVLKFLRYAKKLYDLTADIFIFGSLDRFNNPFDLENLKLLPRAMQIDGLRNMNQAIRSFFKDEKTIQLFERFATYNGSNPFQAPATLNVIAHVEQNLGAFYPDKGIYEIPKAIYKLALKKGIKFHFNHSVKKIILDNKKAIGVEVAAREISSDLEKSSNRAPQNSKTTTHLADIIISNADVNTTYEKLLSDSTSKTAKKYLKQELSTSVLVFNWGVKGINTNLDIHNILFSNDYQKEFHQLFKEKRLPTDPTTYINITSKYSQSDAPENCENWFVLVNAPINDGQNWEVEAKKLKQNLLIKIKQILNIDLQDKIIIEDILTPKILENRTSSYKGALYGISSNTKTAAFQRHPAKSAEYENLFFCGGSAHPGGGMPLVIESGRLAAEAVIKANN